MEESNRMICLVATLSHLKIGSYFHDMALILLDIRDNQWFHYLCRDIVTLSIKLAVTNKFGL